MLQLYTYFRSSAAYRVRIALNLKGLAYQAHPVHLLKGGGEQFGDAYQALNPAALVPTLTDGDLVLTQSLAILEYLEETRPQVPLLPPDAPGRARVRALALTVACDIHPLNNLRVMKYLGEALDVAEDARREWYRHWTAHGLEVVERLLASNVQTGIFCHGDTPTLADCCLIPQVFNAQRFDIDLTEYPTLRRIADYCAELPPFIAAHPAQQPDAE